MTSSGEQQQTKSENKALELYSRNIPYAPSLLEIKNQFRQLIMLAVLTILYWQYGQDMWAWMMADWDFDSLGYTGTYLFTTMLFWGWGLFYYILDCYPERFNHYRVQNFRKVST